jgi:hypothetical protein
MIGRDGARRDTAVPRADACRPPSRFRRSRPAPGRARLRRLQRGGVGDLDCPARLRLRAQRDHRRRPDRRCPARPGSALRAARLRARRPLPAGTGVVRVVRRAGGRDGDHGRRPPAGRAGAPGLRDVRLRRRGDDRDPTDDGSDHAGARPTTRGAHGRERGVELGREPQHLLPPALAGVMLAVASPGAVFVVMGLAVACGAVLVATVPGPEPAGEGEVREAA